MTKPWIQPEDFEESAAEKAEEIIELRREDGDSPEPEEMFLSGALWAALHGGPAVEEDDANDKAEEIKDGEAVTLESMFLSGALWQALVAEGRD